MMHYTTKEEVHNRAKDSLGLSMDKIYETSGVYDTNVKNKNYIGDAFELWMGVAKNSRAEADLPEVGVELKATPYKILKNGQYSAKERLVLNIINYMNEANATFETSSFSHKDKLMELAFYHHNTNKPKNLWTFDEAILFSFPEKDLQIIKHDWEIIHQAILDGKAHELSEGMTDYLGACTKGASKKSVKQQPFSPIMAKQRAYCLKAGYMTSILRNYVFGDQQDPAIQKHKFELNAQKDKKKVGSQPEQIATSEELATSSLDEIILKRLNSFKGLSVAELKSKLNINVTGTPKQLNSILIARMLNLKGDSANEAEEIQKADIQIKTISLKSNGKIKESMSFPAFKFNEVVNQSFEDSDFYDNLTKRFLFPVFKRLKNQKPSDDEIIFLGAKFWYLPEKDLEIIKGVYDDTAQTLRNGVQLEVRNGRVYNNFVPASANQVSHVRPHTSQTQYVQGKYSNELPTPATWINRPDNDEKFDPSGRYMTTQCFWLNSTYLDEQITDITEL